MRKKELKLVVTFHTTADAMAMEKACKENNTPGRITRFQDNLSRMWTFLKSAALDERRNRCHDGRRSGLNQKTCMSASG